MAIVEIEDGDTICDSRRLMERAESIKKFGI
jgi:hypothetical protein